MNRVSRVLRLIIAMIVPVIVSMTDQPDDALVRSVRQNNIQEVRRLLKEPLLLDRDVREKAFFDAARLGNTEIFELLAFFVSRRAHRKGKLLLETEQLKRQRV